MMGKRDDFDDFFGDDEDTPVVDTRADGRLYRVPLGRLTANLVNPRKDFGTEDQLIDLGKSLARRQIQACPVVSRGAYLKLWPEQAEQIGDVDYVLVSGERRFRAATLVGLHSLNCVADDNLAADRKTFMEAVVSENVDRQNFDPIEEAYAVQALVAEFGSNRAVAQHFERVDGWVTQRVLLTNLAPPVQDLVRSKAMPLEAARKLGKLARDNSWDAAQQAHWWQEEQDRRAAAGAARAAAKKAVQEPAASPPAVPATPLPATAALSPGPSATPTPPSFTAVKRGEASQPDPRPVRQPSVEKPAAKADTGTSGTVAKPDADRAPKEVVPEPRTEPLPAGKPLPYDDGFSIAHHLIRRMPAESLEVAIRILNEHAAERGLTVAQ